MAKSTETILAILELDLCSFYPVVMVPRGCNGSWQVGLQTPPSTPSRSSPLIPSQGSVAEPSAALDGFTTAVATVASGSTKGMGKAGES